MSIDSDSTTLNILISKVQVKYIELVNYISALQLGIISEREDYPVFIPTFGKCEEEKTSEKARNHAIMSFGDLSNPNHRCGLVAGIICASKSTIKKSQDVNSAKTAFESAIMDIRKFEKNIKIQSRFELINRGRRTGYLKKALSENRLTNINLKTCYTKIKILEPNVESFRWTWATKHTHIKKVSQRDALKMAEQLDCQTDKDYVLKLLNKCDTGEQFIIKRILNNQLRANYTTIVDEKRVTNTCAISGVVLADQDNLPKHKWRDDPEINRERTRPSRSTSIKTTIFIPELGLHRAI